MELNERITQMRKDAGLTQEQLGEVLGVSRQAVSKWESGQANPDVAYIIEMCRRFKVSADWLLLGEERPAEMIPPPLPEEEKYCLYLKYGGDKGIAKKVEELFRDYDVAPAFPWDGPIHRDAANTIIENAPMVLCEGMTRDEATEAAHVFSGWESSIAVYRESDLTEDEEGELHPEGKSVYIPEKPMGPGMVFGMVVLGVIAAILLMSFC